MNFFGKCGIWKELPRPDEIYDYSKYTTPAYLLEDDLDNVDNNTTKSKMSFTLT